MASIGAQVERQAHQLDGGVGEGATRGVHEHPAADRAVEIEPDCQYECALIIGAECDAYGHRPPRATCLFQRRQPSLELAGRRAPRGRGRRNVHIKSLWGALLRRIAPSQPGRRAPYGQHQQAEATSRHTDGTTLQNLIAGVHAISGAVAPTDYETYIRTDELLALQKAPAELTCHDEMQFQVVHQAAELWMKLIGHEMEYFAEQLGVDHLPQAIITLDRVSRIQRILLVQVDVLDTMTSVAYMTIRTGLGRGSGQESPGFRLMLRLPGETVWPAVVAFLERRGKTLREIYEHPHANADLYRLCEGLVDYDQQLQAWRYRHLMLVYRAIGTGTPSLKGKPSDLLAHGMKQRFFPRLWDVRDELFAEWSAAMAKKGADVGYHG